MRPMLVALVAVIAAACSPPGSQEELQSPKAEDLLHPGYSEAREIAPMFAAAVAAAEFRRIEVCQLAEVMSQAAPPEDAAGAMLAEFAREDAALCAAYKEAGKNLSIIYGLLEFTGAPETFWFAAFTLYPDEEAGDSLYQRSSVGPFGSAEECEQAERAAHVEGVPTERCRAWDGTSEGGYELL